MTVVTRIGEEDYYRRVYGGWLGKNIGGTLGAPVEGRMELLELTFYPVLPDGPLENDDLDLQLVWLHALEQYGARLSAKELGREWLEHIFFPFDEYGYALTNLRKGLQPPVAGWFNNPFRHCMGSPIRSEIWAMTAPGAPSVAAYYAYQDAIVDHAGGEGVYGEMFFAAIESACFVESDRDRLLEIGLNHIPPGCRTALAVKDLIRWHREGKEWKEARRLVLDHYGDANFTDAPQNIAFTVLGWLYGSDFEDCLLKAVNCGYDTDCTAATLGAILGILSGPEGLPDRWVNPVGERVVVSAPIRGFPAPANLHELTVRTLQAGKELLAASQAAVSIIPGASSSAAADYEQPTEELLELWDEPPHADRYWLPQGTRRKDCALELAIDYGESGPCIGKSAAGRLRLRLVNRTLDTHEGHIEWAMPEGWAAVPQLAYRLPPGGAGEWEVEIQAPEKIAVSNGITLWVHRLHDGSPWSAEAVRFVLLAANRWAVSGPEQDRFQTVDCLGDRIPFAGALDTHESGTYTAVTRMVNPVPRKLRLIAATVSPVRMWMNGRLVIDCPYVTEWMPAYHRANARKLYETEVPEGVYELRIQVQKGSEPLELYVLPVSGRVTLQPGPYYYLTDIRFDPDV